MDPHAGETDEQRDERERIEEFNRLSSRDGQAQEFRDALMQALTATNLELAGHGIKPRTDAVTQALTMLQADFVAMLPHRNERRMMFAEILENMQRLVTLKLSVGVKPAAELPPEPGKVN